MLLPLETWYDRWPDTVITIALVLLVSVVARVLLVWVINRAVRSAVKTAEKRMQETPGRTTRLIERAIGAPGDRQLARTKALGTMLSSVVTVVISLIAVLTILSILGIPMGPLLTSAGVGGIALAFGAQSLVKDFLSGVFLIAEDQFGVGDVVELGAVTGTVQEVGLRVTRVRDGNGKIWYIRNGEIITVGNVSQGWSNAVVDIAVSYSADANEVITLAKQVSAEMEADQKWQEALLEAPTVLGVESIVGQTMTIRVVAKCAPNQQFGVQRELRERIKTALDQAGIPGAPPAWPSAGTGAKK